MKKKVLMKRILTALAMAAMIPAGETWAWSVDSTNTKDDTLLVGESDGHMYHVWGETTHDMPLFGFKYPDEFKYVVFDDTKGLTITGLHDKSNMSGTNLDITVQKGENEGQYALHASAGENKFDVNNFTAHTGAADSGAISIDNTATNSTVTIHGRLNATFDEGVSGNGIRANASFEEGTNKIIVQGETNITLEGGQVTYTEKKDLGLFSPEYTVKASYNPAAVYAGNDSTTGNITIVDEGDSFALGKLANGSGQVDLNGNATIQIGSNNYGLYAGKNGQINVNKNLTLTATGDNAVGIAAENSTLIYKDKNTVTVEGNPIDGEKITMTDDTSANHSGSSVILNGDANVINVGTNNKAIYAEGVDANGKSNTVESGDKGIGYFAITGNVVAENGGNITLEAIKENSLTDNDGNLIGNRGSLTGNILASGQNGENKSTVALHAKDSFSMTGDAEAKDGGTVTLTAGQNADSYVSLTGNLSAAGAGSSASLSGYDVAMQGDAENTVTASATNGGKVLLTAANDVSLMGALTASGENSQAFMTSNVGTNYISSKSVIAHAGDLDTSTDDQFKNKSVISALYAEDGADITISSAQSNTFLTAADPDDEMQLERVIWAYNGADINIDGTTLISTDRYEKSANSNDIAIAAGTAVGLTSVNDIKDISDEEKAHVNLNYGAGSSVTGDIIAGYAGKVNIDQLETAGDAGINITGNLLAGNNGILNVDLGNGGTLTGRADDYGDAGVVTTKGYTNSFRDPAFSSDIYKGGAVNLTIGAGSTWNVTGQSWITSIDTTHAGKTADMLAAENPFDAMKNNMATIDLVSANTDRKATAHALTIYDMKGDAVFNMSLDGNRDASDMLYMKKANGSYIINVVDSVDLSAMYAKRDNGEIFDGLRFATVGTGSKVSFRAVTIGSGVLNVEYEVGTDSYDGNDENGEYNSTATDGTASGNSEKPGDAMVDDFFESEDKPPTDSENSGEESANGQIMLLAEGDEAAGTSTATTETTNFKLTGVKGTELSDAGKTVVNMSKVNYSNAVYMDRLNKRMGEARYLDGDDGLWVRLRHDRIGKDNAFRSMNTMMELGYDWKAKGQKDGEHRQGVVFDYMRGTADYTNVMGDGDVRRAGVWLYDTWLGDKGHYTDYVVKYGHLSNDFDIYAPTTLEEINGDYSNDVWSVSAEYGRKKDIGNDWYFEPQAQMQYAYVTSADYTTSQGTKVELDGIDSLIGRAGFRLGRDTSEGNTVYFKADILHEFLGDQGIRAMDSTGVLSTTYENEGTWYDVGFGFSHRMGRDSYMFLDLEHSFGNDNADTWQVNVGMNWKV